MADDKPKTADEVNADEQAAIEPAVKPGDAPERSPGEQAAEDREIKRQEAIVKAVAKANETELPKLGGPLREPGLGR